MSPLNTSTRVLRREDIAALKAAGRIAMPVTRPKEPGKHRAIEERPTEPISAEQIARLRATSAPAPVVYQPKPSTRTKLAMLAANLRPSGWFRRG
jgi:hypothetical protein